MENEKTISRLLDIIQQQAAIIASFYGTVVSPEGETTDLGSSELEDAIAAQDSAISGGSLS